MTDWRFWSLTKGKNPVYILVRKPSCRRTLRYRCLYLLIVIRHVKAHLWLIRNNRRERRHGTRYCVWAVEQR